MIISKHLEHTLKPIRKRWALLVGVSNYDERIGNLNYSDDDIIELEKLFKELGYDVVSFRSYKSRKDEENEDDQPTRHNVLARLEEICTKAEEDDMIFFHFSGHGIRLQYQQEIKPGRQLIYEESFLLTSNVGRGYNHDVYTELPKEALEDQGISRSVIEEKLKASKARQTVMSLDACQVGILIKGVEQPKPIAARPRIRGKYDDRKPFLPPDFKHITEMFGTLDPTDIVDIWGELDEASMFNVYHMTRGFALFAASTAYQNAYELNNIMHGAFTWLLLESLKYDEDNFHARKGFVTLEDAQKFVINGLRSMSNELPGFFQESTIRLETTGSIILADYRDNPDFRRRTSKLASGPLSGSRVLYPPNPFFVGRQDELALLWEAQGFGRVTAVTGIGGIGKTQLISEFVHRYGHRFHGGVYWLDFSSAKTVSNIEDQVIICGDQEHMKLYARNEGLEPEEQLEKVKFAWQERRCLLLFDNCEDESLLLRWVPSTGRSYVIVTSRKQKWNPILVQTQRDLKGLASDESLRMLEFYQRAGKERYEKQPLPSEEESQLEKIVARLDHLPLALHLAGCTLFWQTDSAYQILPSQYLQHLEEKGIPESPGDFETGTAHELSIRATFAISYEQLDSKNPIDRYVLFLLAQLAYLSPGKPLANDMLQRLAGSDTDEDLRQKVLDRLAQIGFLTSGNLHIFDYSNRGQAGVIRSRGSDAESSSTEPSGQEEEKQSLHQLIAVYIRERADQRTLEESRLAIERGLSQESTRYHEEGSISSASIILPHLEHVLDQIQEGKRDDKLAAEIYTAYALMLFLLGIFGKAVEYAQQAESIWRNLEEPPSRGTVQSLSIQSETLLEKGEYQKARDCAEQAVEMSTQVLGTHDLDYASSLHHLSRALRNLGEYGRAYDYATQAHMLRTEQLGKNHRFTLQTQVELAEVLMKQDNYTKARELLEEVRKIREETLPSNHPDLAEVYSYLSTTLEKDGKYQDALIYCKKALDIDRQVLGETHGWVAIDYNSVALLLMSLARYVEAEDHMNKAIEIDKKELGEDNPEFGINLLNFARILRGQKKYQKAEDELVRSLKLFEDDDFASLRAETHNEYALLLGEHKKYEKALEDIQRSLAIYIQDDAFGETHRRTLDSRYTLALILYWQGKYTQAYNEAQEVLEKRLALFDKYHPYIADCHHLLALILDAQGNISDAHNHVEKAVAIREQKLGEEHPDTCASRMMLVSFLRSLGEQEVATKHKNLLVESATQLYEKGVRLVDKGDANKQELRQAEEFLQRAWTIREKQLGSEHADTQTTQKALDRVKLKLL